MSADPSPKTPAGWMTYANPLIRFAYPPQYEFVQLEPKLEGGMYVLRSSESYSLYVSYPYGLDGYNIEIRGNRVFSKPPCRQVITECRHGRFEGVRYEQHIEPKPRGFRGHFVLRDQECVLIVGSRYHPPEDMAVLEQVLRSVVATPPSALTAEDIAEMERLSREESIRP